MIFLGLDPGTATTGFGVIDSDGENLKLLDYGCIETTANEILPTRLNQISKDLLEIINCWKPDAIAIEELFFSKNVKTAMTVAHARGAIMQKLAEKGYEIYEYKPMQIKEAVSGYGRADKKQIQRMVQMILDMREIPRPDDAADALAVAICHANVVQFKEKVTADDI